MKIKIKALVVEPVSALSNSLTMISTTIDYSVALSTTSDVSSNAEQCGIGTAADRVCLLGGIGGSRLASQKQADL